MLKGIPSVLSPELLKILMEMGHSDEIVIADGNFPSGDIAKRLIRLDGIGVPEVLDAILKFFPLDTYVDHSVFQMAVVPGDPYKPVIWEEYKKIVSKHEPKASIEMLGRMEFYEHAKTAYAVISTSETALYANIILKKGVVKE